MLSDRQRSILEASGGEVRFDNLTRQLYASDASIYQIEPQAVAFPKNTGEASKLLRAAGDSDISVIPRGAGTGLVGGAIGDGLVIDFARYNRKISDLNLEARTVEVEPGVVLDQLNLFLKPHGFRFGPDVATSSRATLGGMISSNSSGSHVPVYGTTADHVLSLQVVLADGRIETVSAGPSTLRPQHELVDALVLQHAAAIREHMPAGILKRWPGYGLDRWLRSPGNLNDILSGSEGTLAGIVRAKLKIVPLPRRKGLGLLFFASVADAMQATVAIRDLKPAAIEHIDRVLFEQTRDQLRFKTARDLLQLDDKPCEAILLVEFYEDVAERLAALEKKNLGLRATLLTNAAAMESVWALRKAGLSLLTGCKGPAKPITCIEDTAVRPEQLPEYVAGLQAILQPLALRACFYGHAAAGLLHVRPVLDLHTAEDVKKLRQVASEVSALVRQFKGSFAAEHGVGIARTEFMPEQLGQELLEAMRQIKASFDPYNLLNPGKILGNGRYKIDSNLRMGGGYDIKLPFESALAFAAKDGSFVRNLEQCNGCGGCRKDAPTMCPTFVATGDELFSTRGRANTIRATLERRFGESGIALLSPELDAALSNCLGCKACTTECPSNVNLTLLKAELMHARHQKQGLTLRERLLSSVDLLGKLGCAFPVLSNAALCSTPLRWLMEKTIGIDRRRPLPSYARHTFRTWFQAHTQPKSAPRGRVILWDDTFVRYHEPHIGQAAVAVLEHVGFEVALLQDRHCCGRPAFSQGNLDKAKRLGHHNIDAFARSGGNDPILFLEPSCYSMFKEDYRELKLAGAEELSKRSWLFEHFIENLLAREPEALHFQTSSVRVAIHAHCHAKSLLNPAFMVQLAQRIAPNNAVLLETGCCGMAGAFGALSSKYDLSLKVADPLVSLVRAQPPGTHLIASGTSCRHQLEHLVQTHPLHMAELLAQQLPPNTTHRQA